MRSVNEAFLKHLNMVIDRHLSLAKIINFAEDGSTDLAKRSVHLISAKMNGSSRIVSVSFPEKSDQWGLRDNFLKKIKEFKLTFDQLRTGDIKCLNICGDAAPVIVRVDQLFFQNVDKTSKNPTSFALSFVSLALLRASKNRFQHRPCYLKPTVHNW